MRKYIIAILFLVTACSDESNKTTLDPESGNMSDVVVDSPRIWDDNSIFIRIEEFSWIEFDVGFYKSFAERNREDLSDISLRLLSNLQGEEIVAESPRCPEEYKNSTDASIFTIAIRQLDSSYRFAAAANVELCGVDGTGNTLLDFESVEELHNSIGVDW